MNNISEDNFPVIKKIIKSESMAKHTSMFVGGPSEYYVETTSVEELKQILKYALKQKLEIKVIGEGCNILFSDKGFSGLVIKNNIKGYKKIVETDDYVDYKIGAGENWDAFVSFAIDNNLYGIENMSRVPGSVGASVVQNIGCYGQEVSETVVAVAVVEINSQIEKEFLSKDLNFGYRQSRFNIPELDKDKYIITDVSFRLKKSASVNSNYGDVQKYFADHGIIKPDLKTIRQALIEIRDKKFPFPDVPERGSCGSFFNAEVVEENAYNQIVEKLKNRGLADKADYLLKMKASFCVAQGYKIPYGLLIESLGYKGKINGGAKILETHAGVISNFTGRATAKDVYELACAVINDVNREFGVKLRVEPEVVGDFNY